jgi:hypothetical protein
MIEEKHRIVPNEVISAASADYRDTFEEEPLPENVAGRFYEIVPPRWLIATMQFSRPQIGEISNLFSLSALLTHELDPSRWRDSGIDFAKPFLFHLLEGCRCEQMDAIRNESSSKASVAVQLLTPKAEDARHGLNGPLRRPLFSNYGIYARWHFYASLWYGRDLVPTDWFVAKSYRATCWNLWRDGFPQGDTGNVWGDKLRVIRGGSK